MSTAGVAAGYAAIIMGADGRKEKAGLAVRDVAGKPTCGRSKRGDQASGTPPLGLKQQPHQRVNERVADVGCSFTQ